MFLAPVPATTTAGTVTIANGSGTTGYPIAGYVEEILPLGLDGVSCPATSDCWAVGNTGGIVATTNGGATWSTQTSGVSRGLRAISCPSSLVCFAAGASGTLLTTGNGGATWSAQSSGTSEDLTGVSCSSTAQCWVVGEGGVALATSNGGSTWSAQASGTSNTLDAVSCPTGSMCLGVGTQGIATATTTGGSSWTGQTSGTTNDLIADACPLTSVCWAVGVDGTIVSYLGTAADGSGTMTASPLSLQQGAPNQTIAMTYTAAPGGVSDGALSVFVPAGWTAPQGVSGTPGYTTTTCGTITGYVGSGPWTIEFGSVTLSGGAQCALTYGAGGAGSGVTVTETVGTTTFTTLEESSPLGTMTALTTSPSITVEGVLTVTAPATVVLGTSAPAGSVITNASLGDVSYQNTLGDGQTWSVTVGATDLYNTSTGAEIPFTDMSIEVGSTISPAGPTPGAVGPTALAGVDPSPGVSFSDPITLVTGTASQQGSYSQTGDTITVEVPANMANSGLMTATFQYTATG